MYYGDGGWRAVVVAGVLIFMLLLMVSGRVLSRILKKSKFGSDDYMLICAMALSISLCCIAIAYPRITEVAARIGNKEAEKLPDSQFYNRLFIAWTVVYGLAIAASKWAILLLYLRVFTNINEVFNCLVYFMGIVTTAAVIANTFVGIFPCSPISYEWETNVENGTCINFLAFNRYMAIPNVVTGIIMLLMPLPLVLRLNVNALQKAALVATFFHGIIGVVSSCARLIFLIHPDINLGDQAVAQTIWTINEPSNYVIAACLPTLRPVFSHVLPESFFVLSKRRPSRLSTSSFKLSWRKGSWTPNLQLIEKERFQTQSHITGPWDRTHREHGALGSRSWTDLEAARWAAKVDASRRQDRSFSSRKVESYEIDEFEAVPTGLAR